jgi:hypothetical protein
MLVASCRYLSHHDVGRNFPFGKHHENKFLKVGKFSAPENDHQNDHVYHAIHHRLTTKTPPLRTTFSKTTLKNTSKTASFAPRPRPEFFLKN